MTALSFEAVFEGFDDPETERPYDVPQKAADLLVQLKQSYDPLLEKAEQDSAPLLEKATALAYDLDAGILALVQSRIPTSQATANTDFLIENGVGMPVPAEEQMRLMRETPSDADTASTLRVANLTLEQNFQALLDHLTAKRIAEEMDTPTYLERLRGAFKRVHDGSVVQADKLSQHEKKAQRVAGRLRIASDLSDFLNDAIVPKLETEADSSAAFETGVKELSQFAANCSGYLTHLNGFLTSNRVGLKSIHENFCSDSNMAGAEGECRQVSGEIERRAIFRPLPLLWALFITFLVKIVLAHNTSETLHYQAVSILTLSFVATWVLSIYIGIWARNRRMQYLQEHTRAQIQQQLGIDNADKNGSVSFPATGAVSDVVIVPPIKAFTFRGRSSRYKRKIALLNAGALVIPAVLAAVVIATREEVEHDFIAQFPGASPCVLASGHLVFASADSYYVRPSSKDDGVFDWALNRVFPELSAEVVSRDRIISVKKFATDDAKPRLSGSSQSAKANQEQGIAEESLLVKSKAGTLPLRSCVTDDPKRNVQIVTHRGNALGVLGTQSTLDAFSEKTDLLIDAINAKQPINIDLEGKLGGEDTSLTVNLGDTSLDVLTQAISGNTGGGSGLNDPIIVEARNTIIAELSKEVATNIDVATVLAALTRIQTFLGSDTTTAQALSVAFGDSAVFAPNFDLSDKLLLLLGGDEGEGGLSGELKNMRLALEATNEIANKFALELEDKGDENTFVAVLNEQLPQVIERQDALLAVLSAGFSQNASNPVVVTPVVTAPGSSGGGARGGLTQSIFQTTIEVSGGEPALQTIGNTLVLPFFTAPVQADDGLLNTPEMAFSWGADAANLTDPVVADAGVTYFNRIANTLTSCLIDGGTVELDLIGLASRSWDGPIGTYTKDQLNYHLAEGRRLAALRRLGVFISDQEVQERLLIQTSDGSTQSLREMLTFDANDAGVGEFMDVLGRFESESAFEARRDLLIAVAGLDADEKSPLEELFSRSVVLRMIDANDGPCRF